MATITIQKLIKRISNIQNLMAIKAGHQTSQRTGEFEQLSKDLKQLISETTSGVEYILKTNNKTAADLPVRTRRAFQWVTYLSQFDNLELHLDSLQRVNLYLPSYQLQARKKTINFTFYHLGSLYKITENSTDKHITVHESFIHAPDKILVAILDTALNQHSKNSRQLVRDYTFTPAYQEARTRLEYLGLPPGSFAQGIIHSLDQSFNRVNQEYFQGRLAPPHLIWSSRLTYRKFGHYQWDINTVMVSQTLDNHQIPGFVVDYVMYHELLHKKLQTRKVNNRRYSHTKKFREEEQKFIKFEEAKKILNRISQKKS